MDIGQIIWIFFLLSAIRCQRDQDDQTLILADLAEKAIGQIRASVRALLSRSQPDAKAAELSELLSTGTWTHDYGITVEEARKFGLKVSNEMPEEFLQLMSLFPQPVRRQPVEYLPGPRRADRPQQQHPSA